MIYANIINENRLDSLLEKASPMQLMREYYENEIIVLKESIQYQDDMHDAIVSESYDIESIHEGFIGNIVDKIKELLQKFIDWKRHSN